jgi:hypothetical protein
VFISITSSSSSKMDFAWNTYSVFGVRRFYRFIFEEVKPFIIWFYPTWLDYDISLHKVAGLVVVIPTSPRLSKMEYGYSSYGCFGFNHFYLFTGRRVRPRRAGDSGPKCAFAIFVRSFGPKSLGTFARSETPALGSRDSGYHKFLGGAHPSNGSQSLFVAWPETWARDTSPQRPETPG